MTRVSVGFSHQLCDKHLNKERITERLKSMSNLRYNREPITVEEAIKKLEE